VSNRVEFILDGKEAGLVRAWLAASRSVEAYQASLGGVDIAQTASAKSAAEHNRELARAQQLLRSIETAEEAHARQLKEIDTLQWKGLLTTKQAYQLSKQLIHAKFEDKAATEAQAAAHRRLQEVARGAIQSTTTAIERYRANVADLRAAKEKGLLTEEQYTRAVRKQREELLQLTGRLDERKRAERELAEQQRRTLESIATPQEKFNAQLRTLSRLRRENRLTEEQYAAAVKKSKDELKNAKTENQSLMDMVQSRVTGAVAAYASVTAAVGTIGAALRQVIEVNRQFTEEAEQAGRVYDKIFRQFRIQADLRGLEGKEAQNRILDIGEQTGFTEEQATSAATALVSAGVSAKDASGGALKEFIGILNAQGLRDEDPRQYAEAIAQYLNSQGMEVNEANVRAVGIKLQSLKDTKFKLTDLPQLAQIGSGLQGRLSVDEQFATIATLGDSLGANIASTQMRDIFKNLEVAAGKEDAVKALKEIGLTPDQVDFQGEDFSQVMSTLGKALESVSPERQTVVLGKLVEGTNIGTFRLMQAEMARIQGRAGNLNQTEVYDADVAEGSSGRDAAQNRQALRRRRILAERDQLGDLLKGEIAQDSLESNEAPILGWLRDKIFDTTRFLTGDQGAGVFAQEFGVNAVTDSGVQTGVAGSLVMGQSLIASIGKELFRVAFESQQQVAERQAAVTERMANSIEQMGRMLEEQNRLMGAGGGRPNTKLPDTPSGKAREQSGGRP
jgi:myosin heavy subunit